jgi:hypothetical protein
MLVNLHFEVFGTRWCLPKCSVLSLLECCCSWAPKQDTWGLMAENRAGAPLGMNRRGFCPKDKVGPFLSEKWATRVYSELLTLSIDRRTALATSLSSLMYQIWWLQPCRSYALYH